MPHAFADILQSFKTAPGKTGKFFSLPALAKQFPKIPRLPVSMRIVLESVVRNCDGVKVTPEHVRQLARHVAVRIHRRGDQRCGSDHRTHGRSEIGLGVGHADHGHRAVDIEEHTIERERGAQALEQLRLHRVVEVALDGSARESARVDQGRPVHVPRQLIVPREELVTARHGEVGRAAAVRRERARLDVDAADGDAVAQCG